jgi:hypothetical protein
MQTGPNGLGFLHAGGYMPDAASFYCPSAGGTMPKDMTYDISYATYVAQVLWYPLSSPAQLKMLGGLTPEALSSGDYASALAYSWGGSPWSRRFGPYVPEVTVQCDYNYRNVVTFLGWTSTASSPVCGVPNPTDPGVAGVYLGYTKPGVLVNAGVPTFRTQKILGGRAIVSDSFSDNDYGNYTYSSYNHGYGTRVPGPGFGFYAHRDGYNVLYGDWSAKWYGDPQQQIMWWPINLNDWYGIDMGWCSFKDNCVSIWRQQNGTPSGLTDGGMPDMRCGPEVWHVFDTAAGIDVGPL